MHEDQDGGSNGGTDTMRMLLLVLSVVTGMMIAAQRVDLERRSGWWLGVTGKRMHTIYDTENLTRTRELIALGTDP